MLDRDLVEVTLLTLKEEEERALDGSVNASRRRNFVNKTHLHLVHDSRGDDESAFRVLQRMSPARYWNTVLWRVHMPVDDVVLAAYKHARRAVVAVRSCELTTRYLYKEIGSRIGRFTPFPHYVVQTKVKLVIRKHLDRKF